MFFSKSLKNIDDREYLGKEEYTILKSPNDPLIKYKGVKFSTKADLFIYKNQNYVNDNMKWLDIQTFKLFYDSKYSLQCLYIKNANSKNKSQIMIYSQCFLTNFVSSLPFLIDLSNYLKINIITYEYNNKDKETSNYLDINILFNYLYKIEFINSIILLGLSTGNIINMDVLLSKINFSLKEKLKAFIFISPTWVYDLSELKKLKNFSSIRGNVGQFLEAINVYKIPIFIIHGMQDLKVKYFLSMSFSQKINNKFEWFPKNGNHYNIINEHRTKLFIKIKEFLNHFNLLNNEKTDFDNINKMNEEELKNKNTMEGRSTAFFNNNTIKTTTQDKRDSIEFNLQINKNNINDTGDDDYYSHYNFNDILGNRKKTNNKKEKDNKKNDIYSVCESKIKNEDNITVNQSLKEYDDVILNQNMKNYDDISINRNNNKTFENISANGDFKDYNNVTLNNNFDYDNLNNITINQNNIEFDENENIPRISTVSFIPGDIIPTIKNRNPNQSFIYRKNTRAGYRSISFASFNV